MGTDSKLKKTNKRIRKFFSRIFRKKRKGQKYEEFQDVGGNKEENINEFETKVKLYSEDLSLGSTSSEKGTQLNESLDRGNTVQHASHVDSYTDTLGKNIHRSAFEKPNISHEEPAVPGHAGQAIPVLAEQAVPDHAEQAPEVLVEQGGSNEAVLKYSEADLRRLFPLSYDRHKAESSDVVDDKASKKRKKGKKKKKRKKNKQEPVQIPTEPLPKEIFNKELESWSVGNQIPAGQNIDQEMNETNLINIRIEDSSMKEECSEGNGKYSGKHESEIDNTWEEPDLIQFYDVEPETAMHISQADGGFHLSDTQGSNSKDHSIETLDVCKEGGELCRKSIFMVEIAEVHYTPLLTSKIDEIQDSDVEEFFGVSTSNKDIANVPFDNQKKENDGVRDSNRVSPAHCKDPAMCVVEEPITQKGIHVYERNQQGIMTFDESIDQAEARVAGGEKNSTTKEKKKRKQKKKKKKKGKTKVKFQVDKEHLRIETLRYEQIQTDRNINEPKDKKNGKSEKQKKKKWKKGAKKAGEATWKVLKTGWKYMKTGMLHYSGSPSAVVSLAGKYDANGQPKYGRW